MDKAIQAKMSYFGGFSPSTSPVKGELQRVGVGSGGGGGGGLKGGVRLGGWEDRLEHLREERNIKSSPIRDRQISLEASTGNPNGRIKNAGLSYFGGFSPSIVPVNSPSPERIRLDSTNKYPNQDQDPGMGKKIPMAYFGGFSPSLVPQGSPEGRRGVRSPWGELVLEADRKKYQDQDSQQDGLPLKRKVRRVNEGGFKDVLERLSGERNQDQDSRSSMQDVKQVSDEWDSDARLPNGRLKDLSNATTTSLGTRLNLDAGFDAIDVNHDGVIDREEWESYVKEKEAEKEAEKENEEEQHFSVIWEPAPPSSGILRIKAAPKAWALSSPPARLVTVIFTAFPDVPDLGDIDGLGNDTHDHDGHNEKKSNDYDLNAELDLKKVIKNIKDDLKYPTMHPQESSPHSSPKIKELTSILSVASLPQLDAVKKALTSHQLIISHAVISQYSIRVSLEFLEVYIDKRLRDSKTAAKHWLAGGLRMPELSLASIEPGMAADLLYGVRRLI